MAGIYSNIIRPLVFGLDAETAHEIGIESLRVGLGTDLAQRIAANQFGSKSVGEIERFGLLFANPLGVAAGFDKNAVVVNQLSSLGFGFVEVGTVTFEPQKGNERPRLFRLPEDEALINRLGFNNDGAAIVAERLRKLDRKCIVGVNIGRNKNVPNEEAVENYLASFELVHEVADYIAVNISSPNTPDLRELQRPESLHELLAALQGRNLEVGHKALILKVAPDLSDAQISDIVHACEEHKISGIIATNTTTERSGLRTTDADRFGTGGLSGKPLAGRSNEVIKSVFRHSNGTLPIIGVGGIFTAEDAFEKIAAGASLLQAYTGFVYGGPGFARRINDGLVRILNDKGFSTLDEAVGSNV